MKVFQSRLFRIILPLAGIAAVLILTQSIYALWRRKDTISEREQELLRVEAENTRLREELRQSQETGFIEREARDKLGLVKEGETVVLMGKSQGSNPNDQNSDSEALLPNWKQWWKLFF